MRSRYINARTIVSVIPFFVAGLLIYFPLFGHLDTFPIRIWDESRLANNAYEMYKNGDWIVTHFDGQPDMWSTKPPLMIWLQVIFMKIIGINELAVRLPSSFAALFTCIILIVFSRYYLKDYWPGLIASIVLCTTHGYISFHGARSGDYDALLTFFTTSYVLSFFLYLEKEKPEYLYLTFIAVTMAVMTKSIAGLLFLPGLFIFTLFERKLLKLLRSRHFYFGLIIFIVTVAGYYFIREHKNPGYLEAVYNNDLWGRYNTSSGGHTGPFSYYYDKLMQNEISNWQFFLPFGIIAGFSFRKKEYFKFTILGISVISTFFVIISASHSKLRWYDIPAYPLVSFLVAFFIFFIFKYLKEIKFISRYKILMIVPLIYLVFVFYKPYQNIMGVTFTPTEREWDKDYYRTSYFLKDALAEKTKLDNYHIVIERADAHILFYVRLLQDQGSRIAITRKENLGPGDQVLVQDMHLVDYMKDHFECELLLKDHNLEILKINARKSPDLIIGDYTHL